MSTMLAGAGVVLAAGTLSATGFLLVSRFIPERWLVADSDAAGALYATIGMVYAILVAIAAIAVWEPRTDASQSTDREAASLSEALRSAKGLGPQDRADVQTLIGSYLREVTENEWASLRDQRVSTPRAEDLFTALRDRAEAVEPATEREQNASQQVIGQITEAADARRGRLSAAAEGMPDMLWPILIVGGFVSIMFLYFFGLARTFPNGLMMAVVGGMVALMLFVLYQVEYPFSRGFAISPDSFRTAGSQLTGP